jgi:hypothetical protein
VGILPRVPQNVTVYAMCVGKPNSR